MTHDDIIETAEASAFLEIPEDEAPNSPLPRAARTGQTTPLRSLPLLLLQEALTRSELRRIRDARAFCLVVEAPSPAWVVPLEKALRSLGSWTAIEVRDGTTRFRRKPEDGAAELAERIAAGQRVAAISHAPSALLPACLIDCADIRVTLGHPSDRVIRAAIKAATGSMPRRVPARLGLDLADLLSCIRVGSTAASCVSRLRKAALARARVGSAGENLPHVLDLHGYGEATDFARNLLTDLKAWRAGHIPFEQISRTLLLVSEPGLGKSSGRVRQ